MVVIATLEEEDDDDAVRARISATGGNVKAERERAFLLVGGAQCDLHSAR